MAYFEDIPSVNVHFIRSSKLLRELIPQWPLFVQKRELWLDFLNECALPQEEVNEGVRSEPSFAIPCALYFLSIFILQNTNESPHDFENYAWISVPISASLLA